MTIILALALAASSPVCTKLSADFVQNEKEMLQSSEISERALKSNRETYDLLGTKFWSDQVDWWEQRGSENDRRHSAAGAAITQLMIGHKCKLPDHITGSKNPNSPSQSRSAAAQ